MIGKKNIWSLVANEHQNSPMADLDWAEMEGLFCQQMPPMLPQTSCYSSNGVGADAERRRREPTEVIKIVDYLLKIFIWNFFISMINFYFFFLYKTRLLC